jgi:ubiquinol-cytochrome c reductase cytochrome b subunit
LVSAVPWIGDATRDLIWGGFSVGNLFCLTLLFYLVFILIEWREKPYRIYAESRIGPHDRRILEIIFGSLLGDAHAERRNHENGTRIRFKQEGSHSAYAFWLHSAIANLGYTNSVPPLIRTILDSGKVRQVVRFNTWSYSSFNWIRDTWYVDGVKVIPDSLEMFFTPIAFAIWIMDDGCKNGSGLRLATNCFTYAECLKLINLMHSKYGLKATVISAGNPTKDQFCIYIWKRSMNDLRAIVSPHIVPSMRYKII